MKQLIIHGDPGIRKGAVIRLGDEEVVCFGIQRQGEYHGPERVQLWCTVGDRDEVENYERREYVPHFLDIERVDAADVEVVSPQGDLVTS